MKWAHSLIRISNHQVETLQKRLGAVVEARAAAEMKLVMLHAEAESEAAHVDQDAHAGFYRITFLKGWRFRRDQALAAIEAAKAEEEGARDALSRAFEELKKFERVAEIARGRGATTIRVSHDEQERVLFWAGRKAAFPAVGQISPDYMCLDGSVPRGKLVEVLAEMRALSKQYGLRVVNVLPGSVRTAVAANALQADGSARGESDANIEAGMDPAECARRILHGLAEGQREIVVAEGAEAFAAGLRWQDPERLFDMLAAEGKRLADARAEGKGPEPALVNRTFE